MIALVDFGAGNLRSVQNALERLGASARIATAPDEIAGAQAVILPGVGAAGPAMTALRQRRLDLAIVDAIKQGVPFLGICLGLQLLFERSNEDGAICLGVFAGAVQRLETTEKLPHVGWNTLDRVRPHPVLSEIQGQPMYFVHSYVVVPADPELTAAETTHGIPFVSAIATGSLVGVQFHPERSGTIGLALLENFLHFARIGAAHVA